MPDEEAPAKEAGTTPVPAPEAAVTTARRRTKRPATPTPPAPASDAAPEKRAVPEEEKTRVPKRAVLDPRNRQLLAARDRLDRSRPVFGRQAANRYYRIGRDGAWRRPRGLQSKQRRHYGYRPKIVRIGYRSPARVRGLVPSGFRPVLVRTSRDLEALDGRSQAAIIARTVGTRRRLVLEEEARKLGIRVLNPIVKGGEET